MSDPVTYTAALPIGESTVARLAQLLDTARLQRRTRAGRRVLDVRGQAILVLRWFCDATRVVQLATDNQLSLSTAYRYLHEGIDVLAAAAPELHEALAHAQQNELPYVTLDGTLVPTDRVAERTENGNHAWYSAKHKHFGGNIQGIRRPHRLPVLDLPGRARLHPRHHRSTVPLPGRALPGGRGRVADSGGQGLPRGRHRGVQPDQGRQ